MAEYSRRMFRKFLKNPWLLSDFLDELAYYCMGLMLNYERKGNMVQVRKLEILNDILLRMTKFLEEQLLLHKDKFPPSVIETLNGLSEFSGFKLFEPARHAEAKDYALELLRKGNVVRVGDHTGWYVTFFPPDGEKYITPTGYSLKGGRVYLLKYDAGLVPTYTWYVEHMEYRPEEWRKPFGTLKSEP